MNYIDRIKRLIRKLFPRQYLKVKREIKHLAVADDSDIFILLLWAASSFKSDVFFRQGKSSDKEGILYTEIYPLAEQLGEDVCKVLHAFHALTGNDYTSSFFWKNKVYLLQENDCASRKLLFLEVLESSKC